MAWFAVDNDGAEGIYMDYPQRERDVEFGEYWQSDHWISITRGSIEAITGIKLTWDDEPLEISCASQQSTSESVKNDFQDHKLRWELLPLIDVEDIVKVYTAGAKKYGPDRWQALPDGYQRYKAALLRHLLEHEKGNVFDEETGCRHLAQVAWNAIAMLHLSKEAEKQASKENEESHI